jgi:hypothetical protein
MRRFGASVEVGLPQRRLRRKGLPLPRSATCTGSRATRSNSACQLLLPVAPTTTDCVTCFASPVTLQLPNSSECHAPPLRAGLGGAQGRWSPPRLRTRTRPNCASGCSSSNGGSSGCWPWCAYSSVWCTSRAFGSTTTDSRRATRSERSCGPSGVPLRYFRSPSRSAWSVCHPLATTPGAVCRRPVASTTDRAVPGPRPRS